MSSVEAPPFPRIKQQEMPAEMRELALEVVTAAYQVPSTFEEKAKMLSQTFERKFGPAWHCIVGSAFGSYVIHEVGHFIQLEMLGEKGDIETVLLYKMGSADLVMENKLIHFAQK